MRASLTQGSTGNITIKTEKKHNELERFFDGTARKQKGRVAIEIEMTSYKLVFGKVIYFSSTFDPVVAVHASSPATKTNALQPHHLKFSTRLFVSWKPALTSYKFTVRQKSPTCLKLFPMHCCNLETEKRAWIKK